jgi:guanylate kinase
MIFPLFTGGQTFYQSCHCRKCVEVIRHEIYYSDIDVKGAVNLGRILKNEVKVITVFLYIDKEELERRLVGRGDSPEQIRIRMGRYEEEMSYFDAFDYRIENKCLEETVQRVKEIIRSEQEN